MLLRNRFPHRRLVAMLNYKRRAVVPAIACDDEPIVMGVGYARLCGWGGLAAGVYLFVEDGHATGAIVACFGATWIIMARLTVALIHGRK